MKWWPFSSKADVNVWQAIWLELKPVVADVDKLAHDCFPSNPKVACFEIFVYLWFQADIQGHLAKASPNQIQALAPTFDPIFQYYYTGDERFTAVIDSRIATTYDPIVRKSQGVDQITQLYNALFFSCEQAASLGRNSASEESIMIQSMWTSSLSKVQFLSRFPALDGVWQRWFSETFEAFPSKVLVDQATWDVHRLRATRIVSGLL